MSVILFVLLSAVNSQVNKIVDIIREVYINTNALHNAFSSASKRILQKNDIENIRAQKSVSGYQISFTLLNADPKSVLPQWDIKQATSKFLSPFLQKFDFLDTSVDSQVIHYSSLQIKPKTKDQIHYLKHQDLPHLINPIETSLARLLERISNMVIGDQIQKQVQQALDAIHKSKDYLENGKVKEAFFQAKIALVSSEKAFFDPSILALLYFPDDQKYAIYIPLFLPISLPVIISLFKGAKWLKNGDQPKPTDEKKNN
ncbi:GPI transamidase component PIG-S [Exaiptasia diaphana]|uniref:GPI transamidase component PIG-S n=1 Tax=Exaiptasia diaphana TaxID=2652724 RepID=A0A913XKC8_EXADI|nr:GPI transamidase component PIG-S [Exaiptasia diaphana]